MLMKTFSVIPVMPSANVSVVRPAIRSGLPATAAFTRSIGRSSIGNARFRPASTMNMVFISASFAGISSAKSWARLKSFEVS